jgi:hypothetical protein
MPKNKAIPKTSRKGRITNKNLFAEMLLKARDFISWYFAVATDRMKSR